MRIWWVLVLVLGVGCKPEQPPAPKVTPPTVAEAEAFAKVLVWHLSPCNPVALDEHVDFGLLVARAVAGRKYSAPQVAQFRKEFNGQQMCRDLKDAKFVYLRTQMIDGVPRPLLRGLSSAGVNYMQLEIDMRNGRMRLADMYLATAGERFSDTLRNLLDATFAEDAVAISATFKRIGEARVAGNLAEARELIRTLPGRIRATKAIRLLHIQVLDNESSEYLQVVEAFVKAFPGDPALLAHEIDRAFLRNEFDRAITAIDALDRFAGGDPYLDVLRIAPLLKTGRYTDAIAAAKRATVREPTLADGWWALATSQAASKDFTGALATFEVLRDRFGAATDADTLRTDERFTALADSAEYAAWSKR